MQENIKLIQEITTLRKDVYEFRSKIRATDSTMGSVQGSKMDSQSMGNMSHGNKGQNSNASFREDNEAERREAAEKKQVIEDMRNRVKYLMEENQIFKAQIEGKMQI